MDSTLSVYSVSHTSIAIILLKFLGRGSLSFLFNLGDAIC